MAVISAICAVAMLPFNSTFLGGLFFLCLFICGAAIYVLNKISHSNNKYSSIAGKFALLGKILFILWLISFIIIEGLIISGCVSDDIPDNTDYIVLLGAGIYYDRPSATLYYRLKTATEYLTSNEKSKVIVCGGQGENEIMPEAEVMSNTLQKTFGIDKSRIIIEDKSKNTVENIANAKQILDKIETKKYSTAVITSNFHLYRARSLMEKNGLMRYGMGSKTPYPIIDAVYFIREYFSHIKLIFTESF